MRPLHKHSLSSDKALAFYTETLEGTNAFSKEALKIVSGEPGQFFTLLPDNANLEDLHQFSSSILPQGPRKMGSIGSLSGVYTHSPVASLELEFSSFLYDQIHTHGHQFMSDNFNATYKEGNTPEWFNLYGAHYLEEVYYFLSPRNATPRLIEQCLCHSKTFWHSLCILSSMHIDKTKKTLQLSDIRNFCKHGQFILVGAYDGEGYIIWQKKSENK